MAFFCLTWFTGHINLIGPFDTAVAVSKFAMDPANNPRQSADWEPVRAGAATLGNPADAAQTPGQASGPPRTYARPAPGPWAAWEEFADSDGDVMVVDANDDVVGWARCPVRRLDNSPLSAAALAETVVNARVMAEARAALDLLAELAVLEPLVTAQAMLRGQSPDATLAQVAREARAMLARIHAPAPV